MTERKRDWEVVTGWEKRIKVDFGSIGPNHVRWSDWTNKERDIVARKVYESTKIADQYGPRSKAMEDWAAENAPIMIDFARDGKPMPDWAHAQYRPSGIPEFVRVVWDQPDPAGMGKWAYDPPGPWEDKGEEPEWSAQPMDSDYDPNLLTKTGPKGPKGEEGPPGYGYIVGDLRWHGLSVTDPGKLVMPVTDIAYPEGMDELLASVESKDGSRGGWVSMSPLEALGNGAAGSYYTETVRDAKELTFVIPQSYNIEHYETAKIGLHFRKSNGGAFRPDWMYYELPIPVKDLGLPERSVGDSVPEPLRSFLQWALEKQHGGEHQIRWCRVALAMGHDGRGKTFSEMEPVWRVAAERGPMSLTEATDNWERFNRNDRWTLALDALKAPDSDIVAANRYRESVGLPPVEESQAEKLREALVETNERPDVVVKEFDPDAGKFREITMTAAQKRERDLDSYKNAPPMQGHYTAVEWERMHGKPPTVVLVEKWNRLAILDQVLTCPNYWLEGEGKPTQTWLHSNGGWVKLSDATTVKTESEKPAVNVPTVFSSPPPGEDDGVQWEKVKWPAAGHKNVPVPDAMAEAIEAEDWSTVARLAIEQMG